MAVADGPDEFLFAEVLSDPYYDKHIGEVRCDLRCLITGREEPWPVEELHFDKDQRAWAGWSVPVDVYLDWLEERNGG